ncbi:MAG: hypothetical protein HN790_05575 [Methylococcales bacterium]|nr:hypothetical protein [Methylococcales bacterium]
MTQRTSFGHYYLLLLVSLLLYVSPVQASSSITVDIQAFQGSMDLSNKWSRFIDDSGNISIEQIQDKKFTLSSREMLGEGFVGGALWVKFSVKNAAYKPWLMEIGWPLIDRIDMYIVDANGYIEHDYMGQDWVYSQRKKVHQNFVWPLKLPSNDEHTIYLRVENEKSMMFFIRLWDEGAFEVSSSDEKFLYGLYFGGMLILAFYNIFIFISTRDKNYILYS